MIDQLSIHDVGVIEDADLTIGSGLTALSGETGAGKTMALTSLQFLLGAKADSSRVRDGAQAARVEGSFVVPVDSPIVGLVEEAGGSWDHDDGEAVVLVARTVPANGRSAAFLGGRRVPTATLAAAAEHLVTVHGQSDQIRLATPSQQRAAVDRFGGAGLAQAAEAYRAAYEEWLDATRQLAGLEAHLADRARERLALEALVAEIDKVAPREDEDEELRDEARRLEGGDELFAALSRAAEALAGSDSDEPFALLSIDAALRALEGVESEHAVRLEAARAELTDLAATLADEARGVDADPQRLAEIYSRRQELAGLRKTVGMPLNDAIAEANRAREVLADLGDPEAARERVVDEVRVAKARLGETSRALTDRRQEAAEALGGAIELELRELALPNARVTIEVTPTEPGPNGADDVTFLLAPHVGAVALPISQAASGGELSRVMLAVEVALAERSADASHTFLFDEIDAGIGGSAGLAVGRRLARLARHHQVIVVTHLAQVAACASQHLVVVKHEGEETTRTEVRAVEGAERIDELARMLSGNVTDTARTHAAELLSHAGVAR